MASVGTYVGLGVATTYQSWRCSMELVTAESAQNIALLVLVLCTGVIALVGILFAFLCALEILND